MNPGYTPNMVDALVIRWIEGFDEIFIIKYKFPPHYKSLNYYFYKSFSGIALPGLLGV